jgi:hypothetical protein
MTATDRTDWDRLLDEMEEAARSGAAFRPPERVTPIPWRLLDRVTALLQQWQENEAALRSELAAVGAELDHDRRARRRASTGPAGASLEL